MNCAYTKKGGGRCGNTAKEGSLYCGTQHNKTTMCAKCDRYIHPEESVCFEHASGEELDAQGPASPAPEAPSPGASPSPGAAALVGAYELRLRADAYAEKLEEVQNKLADTTMHLQGVTMVTQLTPDQEKREQRIREQERRMREPLSRDDFHQLLQNGYQAIGREHIRRVNLF